MVVWCSWPRHCGQLSMTRSTRLFSRHHGGATTTSWSGEAARCASGGAWHDGGIVGTACTCSATASKGTEVVVGVRVSVMCLCTQRPEMSLAYALTVWSAMAGVAKSGGKQGRVGRSP